jgi:hypothetical protein
VPLLPEPCPALERIDDLNSRSVLR